MSKTNIKCPRCNLINYISLVSISRLNKSINASNVSASSHLATVKDYLKEIILDVLNVVKEHTYITHINITIATNAITKSVTHNS